MVRRLRESTSNRELHAGVIAGNSILPLKQPLQVFKTVHAEHQDHWLWAVSLTTNSPTPISPKLTPFFPFRLHSKFVGFKCLYSVQHLGMECWNSLPLSQQWKGISILGYKSSYSKWHYIVTCTESVVWRSSPQRGQLDHLSMEATSTLSTAGRDDKIYWRCAKSRSSSGSVTTQDNQIVATNDSHNHPPYQAALEADKIVSTLKKKAAETIQPVPLTYQEQLQHIARRANMDEVAAKLPMFTSIKSSLYRQKRKHLPAYFCSYFCIICWIWKK